MTSDPFDRFEKLAKIAETEAAPNTNVANAVMQRLSRRRVARIDHVDRSRLWFAGVTTAAALVTCLLAWPNAEVSLDSYALLWSPLGGTLP